MNLKYKGKAISPVHIHDPTTNEINDEGESNRRMKDAHAHHRLRHKIVEHNYYHWEQQNANYINPNNV